jgi:hypothetical protein
VSGVWSQPIHVQWVRRPEATIKLNFESIDCLWHNYWQKYTSHSVSPISLLKTNAGLLMGPCGQLGKKSPTNPRAMDQATRLIIENKSFFSGFLAYSLWTSTLLFTCHGIGKYWPKKILASLLYSICTPKKVWVSWSALWGQRHLGVSIRVQWEQGVLTDYEELFSSYILRLYAHTHTKVWKDLPPKKCFAMCLERHKGKSLSPARLIKLTKFY